MATLNPLEQKARSSFIKGILLSSLIGIIIIAVLTMLIFNMNGKEKERIAAQKTVAILNKEVKSGDEITTSMVVSSLANGEVAPIGALKLADFIALTTVSDSNGNQTAVKVLAKIDIPAKTILTKEMINTEDSVVTNDLREQEYNVVILPSQLTTGDTIDVRLRLPSGVDYIVLSKKKVTIPELGVATSTSTMQLNVSEDEILTMGAATVDAYKIAGSKFYATKYTEPGLQTKATATYVPSNDTISLIDSDPNIVATARNALISRYNSTFSTYRGGVSGALSSVDSATQSSSVQAGTSTEISTQETERKQYLDAMSGK